MRIAEVLPDGSIRRAGANEILRKCDVWGGIRNTQELPAPWSPLLYCGSLGHPSENATGLIYMRARYYDPVLGRFISEDPARDGGNWYAYAGNNPIGNVDPDGRVVQSIIAVAYIGAGFGLGGYLGYTVGYDWFVRTQIADADPEFGGRSVSLGDATGAGGAGAASNVLTRGAAFGRGIGGLKLLRNFGVAGAAGFAVGFHLGVLAAEINFISEWL